VWASKQRFLIRELRTKLCNSRIHVSWIQGPDGHGDEITMNGAAGKAHRRGQAEAGTMAFTKRCWRHPAGYRTAAKQQHVQPGRRSTAPTPASRQ